MSTLKDIYDFKEALERARSNNDDPRYASDVLTSGLKVATNGLNPLARRVAREIISDLGKGIDLTIGTIDGYQERLREAAGQDGVPGFSPGATPVPPGMERQPTIIVSNNGRTFTQGQDRIVPIGDKLANDRPFYTDVNGTRIYPPADGWAIGGLPEPETDPTTINSIKKKFDKAATIPSPIILDLDGDGVETVSLGVGPNFDHASDGFAEQTGWVGKDDGLLVRDLNGDGKISTGRELFGSETLLANASKAANGFAALAELDTNLDGKLEISDAAFNTLQIWKDANGNGITDAGELLSLADAGVQSISVAYINSAVVDANDNQHRQVGSFTTTAGQVRAAEDVWFQTDTTYSIPTTRLAVPTDVAALPNVKGFGKVHDLQQAMVRDTSGVLKSLVTQFTQATSIAGRQALVDSIIFQWAGVQNVSPTSRAATQIYGNVIGDARKLEALEEFMGEEWVGIWCWGTNDPNPHGQATPATQGANRSRMPCGRHGKRRATSFSGRVGPNLRSTLFA